MPTFILTPNQRILSRYLTSATDTDFDAEYPNYIPQAIENTVKWKVFDDEASFEASFRNLLKGKDIAEHYDNLLFLTLYVYDKVWQNYEVAQELFESKKRAKEIAELLLMLKGTAKGKLSNINFKSFNNSIKLTDTILNDWISSTLTISLQNKSFPISQFGTSVLEIFSDGQNLFDIKSVSVDRLKQYANMHVSHPKKRIRKDNVVICSMLLSYLNGETTLSTSKETNFSDAQLNFLFDLLELLQQVERDKVGSDEKDYMRAMIVNSLKL